MANNWKYWNRNGQSVEWAHGDALPAGADLLRAEFLNQFVTAINERHAVASSVCGVKQLSRIAPILPTVYPMAEIVAGDDITRADAAEHQPYNTILGMQRSINTLAALSDVAFTFRKWIYDGGNTPEFSGSPHDFDLSVSRLNALCSLADTAPDVGFRRSTDGAVFSAGLMTRGDIVGPWIFADMRAVLHVLRWFADKNTGSLANGSGTTNVIQCFSRSNPEPQPDIPWNCTGSISDTAYIAQVLTSYTTTDNNSASRFTSKSFVGYPFAGQYLFTAWVKTTKPVGSTTYHDFYGLGPEGSWAAIINRADDVSAGDIVEEWFISDTSSEPSHPGSGDFAQALTNGFLGASCIAVVSKEFQYE